MTHSNKPKKRIQVQIKLFATLSKYLPPNAHEYAMSSGKTAGDLADHLNLPMEQVKLIFINGRQRPLNTVLSNKDRIGIFPPVGGG